MEIPRWLGVPWGSLSHSQVRLKLATPFSQAHFDHRNITRQQHDYLLSLPLVLHIPSLHYYIVHAGILPIDPSLPLASKRQPLGHIPFSARSSSYPPTADLSRTQIEQLRTEQELAILSDIPQNNDPFTTLNMRSLVKKGRNHVKGKEDVKEPGEEENVKTENGAKDQWRVSKGKKDARGAMCGMRSLGGVADTLMLPLWPSRIMLERSR